METTIQVNDIKKSLDGRQILRGVTFEVNKGDIFGFLGPNGAGKTTTIRTIMGLYKPDSGSVKIMNKDVRDLDVRSRIGFAFDPDGLYDAMSAEENLAYYLKIYKKPVEQSKILQSLELLGLKERAQDKAGTFSKGMRQRLTIARAIVHDPDVLILDEPTSGVDPIEQIKIRNLLIEIAEKLKKTVFLSTHNMDEVQRICNKIAILNKGKIQLCGELSELRKNMGEHTVTVSIAQSVPAELDKKLRETEAFGFLEKMGPNYKFGSRIETSKLVELVMSYGLDVTSIKKNQAGIEQLYSSIVLESQKTNLNGGQE